MQATFEEPGLQEYSSELKCRFHPFSRIGQQGNTRTTIDESGWRPSSVEL